MLLIAALGKLMRGERDARLKFEEKRSLITKLKYWAAMAAKRLLVPLICCVVSLVVVTLLASFVAAIYLIDLLPIWVLLILFVFVRLPVEAIWRTLGVVQPPIDFTGFDSKAERFLLTISEGPSFKYYFTAFMQVASNVLQMFVLTTQMRRYQRIAQPAYWNAYLQDESNLSDVYDKIFIDFFRLTTTTLQVSWGAFDPSFWLKWTWTPPVFAIGDLAFIWVSQLTYSVGMLSLAIEFLLEHLEELWQFQEQPSSEEEMMPSQGGDETPPDSVSESFTTTASSFKRSEP
jgi:hypothetical protein